MCSAGTEAKRGCESDRVVSHRNAPHRIRSGQRTAAAVADEAEARRCGLRDQSTAQCSGVAAHCGVSIQHMRECSPGHAD